MPGWFYALLGWVGGVAATVAGSWTSSKIQGYHESRRAHLEDLRAKVLMPLRAGLAKHFRPLLFQQVQAVLLVDSAQQMKKHAGVTEEPTSAAPLLVAAFAFGSAFAEIEPALFDDARSRHFPALIGTLDVLDADWTDWARDCHEWVCGVAGRILEPCGLPPFIQNRAGPYVMNARLALFIYRRLFRFETGALQKLEERGSWILTSGNYTLASASLEQIDALIAALDALLSAEADRAEAFRKRVMQLQRRFEAFSIKLDTAIASRKLHGRCDLVSFF